MSLLLFLPVPQLPGLLPRLATSGTSPSPLLSRGVQCHRDQASQRDRPQAWRLADLAEVGARLRESGTWTTLRCRKLRCSGGLED